MISLKKVNSSKRHKRPKVLYIQFQALKYTKQNPAELKKEIDKSSFVIIEHIVGQ